MEKMPLLVLVFYSIPESIILISLSSALYGYDVKNNLKRIFLLGVCLALITYVARLFPLGVNVIIELPVFLFLTTYILKISLKRSVIIILTGFAILSLVEMIWYPLASSISGQKLSVLLGNTWSRLKVESISLVILLIPTAIVVKTRFSFSKTINLFNSSSLNTKASFMIAIVLFQAFLAGSLQIMSYNTKNPVWEQAFNNDILERIIGLSLIAIPIISIFLLKKLFKLAEQEACIQAQEALLDNVNDLFATVKSQRHDFINHIQVLYGLMQLKKYEEAADYLSQLVGETRKAEEILSVDNLAITALLKSKQALSVARKVTFETAINCSLQNLKIRSFDLVKILGNLLDNALDAAAEQDEDFRRVSLRIFRENGRLILQVSNPRPIIPREVTDKLFEEGYTTKEGNHSGEGLFIVKKLASQYGGTIEVLSDETNGTSFIVKLPC